MKIFTINSQLPQEGASVRSPWYRLQDDSKRALSSWCGSRARSRPTRKTSTTVETKVCIGCSTTTRRLTSSACHHLRILQSFDYYPIRVHSGTQWGHNIFGRRFDAHSFRGEGVCFHVVEIAGAIAVASRVHRKTRNVSYVFRHARASSR